MAASAVSRAGRAEKQASAEAALRRPNLWKFYGQDLADVRPGGFTFRLRLLRGRGVPFLELDDVVESFTWEDSAAVLTGSLSLRRPDPARAVTLPIGVGHRVSCDVRWQGRWYRVWTMRVQPPEISLPDAAITVELQDDLALLSRNRRDYSFRKTKRRKRGYFPQEIVRLVAAKEGLRVGTLARGKHRVDRLVKKDAYAIDIIREAYQRERDKTGKRFVIRMRDGRLEVITLQRNAILYEFKEQIQTALLHQEQTIKPVTILEGKGRIGRKNGAKKVKHTEARPAVINRFGKTTKKKDYGSVKSLADLRDQVRRDYAKNLRVKRTATLEVPGVPFIRRGDGIRWVTKEDGWYGSTTEIRDRSFVYVIAARHDVSSSGYTLGLDIVQDDPYAKDAVRQDKEARERARKKKAAK